MEYFEETVDWYNATGKSIYLVGDININIPKLETCNYAQQFLNCLQSYAISPKIDKPIRVYNNSVSFFDNIFLNKFQYYTASGNIGSDLIDNFSQSCILKLTIETTKPWKMAADDYSKYSQWMFLQELSELTWESLPSAEDPSKLFSTFYNKLNKLVNKHASFRTLSKHENK